MNLILFEPAELARPLPRTDPRARHILEVLRRQSGGTFDAGQVNGPRGKATLGAIDPAGLHLTFAWGPPPAPPDPITLLVGLPRPQTARDILRDATTLGVSALHFVRTEKTEASYAQSTLWTSGEWRRHLWTGAEQAFDTRIPEVTSGRRLADVLATLPAASARLALDHYESPSPLSGYTGAAATPHVLALGGERGWSGPDRDALRQGGFQLVHLGPRILRTETAVVAALTLLRARLGLM
ncbi:MAG: 16S rRNA (uracil(1498)-N(3))-methyltransferase [Opitutaceae bacterium]|nr:16S rRNA (uracil(1498)-N(3))-methyltransferase [Opitutaceae bacterium]